MLCLWDIGCLNPSMLVIATNAFAFPKLGVEFHAKFFSESHHAFDTIAQAHLRKIKSCSIGFFN